MAPTSVLTRSGNDAIWYASGGTGAMCRSISPRAAPPARHILINGTTVYNDGTLYPSGTTQTFDLDAVSGGPVAVGEFYPVQVQYTADDATHVTTDIRETETAAGGYVADGVLVGHQRGDVPDQLAGALDGLHGAGRAARTPSATWLRATDTATFTLRRKQQYLYVNYMASGAGTQIRIVVNGTTVSNDSTEYPNGVTKTIDLAAVSGGPVVGGNYRLEIQRNGGSLLLQYFVEGPRHRRTRRRRGQRATRSRQAASRVEPL